MSNNQREVATSGHMIVDEDGRAQLGTLSSSPSRAWFALFDRPMLRREREKWQRKGFRCEMVWVESFRRASHEQ